MINGGIVGPFQVFTNINAPKIVDLKIQQQLQGSGRYPSSLIGSQVYTIPGTYTFVVPMGVTIINAMAVGGGGAGDDGNSGDGGGGGGSGASSGCFNNLSVTPGSSVTVVVGAGGPATTVKGTKAPNGNASTVTYGTFVMTAPGGIGGSPYSANPGAAPPSAPSFSNTPVGVTTAGFIGGGGGSPYDGGGGGGGAAGLEGNGGNGSRALNSDFWPYPSTAAAIAGGGGGGGGGDRPLGSATVTAIGYSSAPGGAGQSNTTGGGGGGCATYSLANPPTAGGNGNGLTVSGSKGGDGGWPGGGGGGSWDGNTGLASKGGDGYVRIVWGPGISYPNNPG